MVKIGDTKIERGMTYVYVGKGNTPSGWLRKDIAEDLAKKKKKDIEGLEKIKHKINIQKETRGWN